MFVYSLISSTIQDLFSILPVSLENARWWSFEGQRYVSKSNCYSLHSCCRILAAAGPQISLDDYGPIARAFQITTSVFQLGRNPANVKLFWISWDHPFFLLSIETLDTLLHMKPSSFESSLGGGCGAKGSRSGAWGGSDMDNHQQKGI